MQTLKLSVSLPDETHPDMELRLSTDDSACDVVIAWPLAPARAVKLDRMHANEALRSAHDDYVLGGYAGI